MVKKSNIAKGKEREKETIFKISSKDDLIKRIKLNAEDLRRKPDNPGFIGAKRRLLELYKKDYGEPEINYYSDIQSSSSSEPVEEMATITEPKIEAAKLIIPQYATVKTINNILSKSDDELRILFSKYPVLIDKLDEDINKRFLDGEFTAEKYGEIKERIKNIKYSSTSTDQKSIFKKPVKKNKFLPVKPRKVY